MNVAVTQPRRSEITTTQRHRGKTMRAAITYILLSAGAFLFLMPLFWTITTALKRPDEIYTFPPAFFPKSLYFQNFLDGWNYPNMNFPRWLLNSSFVTCLVMVGVLVSSSLSAYGFARLRFPAREFLFTMILTPLMLPPQVTLIPIYIAFHRIGWLDTYKPLIIPAWFGGGAFNIFLLRQFFRGIPIELEEAAIIDGANRWQIWRHIFLPLSKPAIATIAVFAFQGSWTDLFGPLIFLTTPEKYTLAVGLTLFKGLYTTAVGPMMAMALLLIIPMVIIFFFAQKQMIQGVVMTGIKA